jgi:crotonobetainyl-CoA:carnitine CoA-transferase CaiB-like acyl-CoA transferase
MTDITKSLFNGLKVCDLSTVLAGPSVASFFAELGADVIKIENPRTRGDVTRSWKLGSENPESSVSAYFASVNVKKTYVWLDLVADRDKLNTYIAQSDILIVNFKSEDYSKFGLEKEQLHAINPRLIIARLKGFDSDENRVAYDIALQAETGFMFMNGTPESGPVKMPVALIDVLAAHQLKEGILSALLVRERTGKGLQVDCSLEKAALASLVNQATNYLMAGHIPQRMGSLHPNIAPYGEIFECADQKQLVLASGSDKQFRKICDILSISEISQDPRFSTNQLRVVNRNALQEIMTPIFKTRNRASWMNDFIAGDVPAGAIRSMDEVMENPSAKSMLLEEIIDEIETKRLSGVAFQLRT